MMVVDIESFIDIHSTGIRAINIIAYRHFPVVKSIDFHSKGHRTANVIANSTLQCKSLVYDTDDSRLHAGIFTFIVGHWLVVEWW